MAIKIDINAIQFGIQVPGAYVRIARTFVMRQPAGSTHKHVVAIVTLAYATDSPAQETREIDARQYEVPLQDIDAQAGDTFLAKCYLWLMQQDSMSGAVEA